MNASKGKKEKVGCMKIYHTVPTLFITYTHVLPLPSHCIHNLQLKHRRSISLEKQTYDSEINKAEHGYNIGMHAVNKHPVNNILRLNRSSCKAKYYQLS